MPSPIAHLGAGYAIYRYYKCRQPENQARLWKAPFPMILTMGLSLLPDLDIIPAIIFRDMKDYHNHFSHSLLLGIPIAGLVAALLLHKYRSHFWLWFLICLISYDLHVIMDMMTADRGVMLFWPVTQSRVVFPIKIFYGVRWEFGWFSIHHLWTIFTESVFVLILVIVVNYFDKRKNTSNSLAQES